MSISEVTEFKTNINNYFRSEPSNSGTEEISKINEVKISLLVFRKMGLLKEAMQKGNIFPDADFAIRFTKVRAIVDPQSKNPILSLMATCLLPPAQNIQEKLPNELLALVLQRENAKLLREVYGQRLVSKKWCQATPVALIGSINRFHLPFTQFGRKSMDQVIAFVTQEQQRARYITSFNLKDCNGVTDQTISTLISIFPSMTSLSIEKWNVTEEAFKNISSQGNLRYLSIQNSALKNMPEGIIQLSKLEVLKVNESSISHIPKGFSELHQLTELSLAGCSCIKEFPLEITALTNLQSLDLCSNRFEDLPSGMEKLGKLEELYMRGSSMITMPDVIGKLTKLRVLNFFHSSISVLSSGITNLTNLQKLDLSDCPLIHPPREIMVLPQLTSFFLSVKAMDRDEAKKWYYQEVVISRLARVICLENLIVLH